MRRLLPLLLLSLLLALPSLAAAERPPNPKPRRAGTLEVTGGRGQMLLRVRGSAIGFVQRGHVVVTTKRFGGSVKTYNGRHLRFRAVDGSYRILIKGIGIDLSAVGRGSVTLVGNKRGYTGEFSLNGEDPQPLPRIATTLQLSAP